ncbi:hypothetical protein ON010_g16137 [Phytophthora cinnamomi]|nr:hypothetical protein ON010_g16137 [Phytophthora cinnamomi]
MPRRGVRREESEGSPAEGQDAPALRARRGLPAGAAGEGGRAVQGAARRHRRDVGRRGRAAQPAPGLPHAPHQGHDGQDALRHAGAAPPPVAAVGQRRGLGGGRQPLPPDHERAGQGELQAEGEGDAPELRTSSRLGKRRTSSEAVEPEPERREVYVLPRPRSEPEQVQSPVRAYGAEATATSVGTVEVQTPRTPVAAPEPVAAPAVEEPVAGDLVTAQQAMAELLKMQHAFAARPSELRVIELEKMNEARLREEEEKTKQRGLELQIEIQRTKRRQLELEFEREERQKDREEQAKLIASLVQRLEPKRD